MYSIFVLYLTIETTYTKIEFMNDKLKCGYKTKSGRPCKMPAGWGTTHPGEGYCTHHDSRSGGIQKQGYPPLLDMVDARTRDYVVRMLEDDQEILDFTKELATYKVKYFEAASEEEVDFELLTKMLRAVAYSSGRLNEIRHGKHVYIHVNVISLLLQAVGETARQYLDTDSREAFSKDLKHQVQKLLPHSTSRGVAASVLSDPVSEVIDGDIRELDGDE